MWNKGQKFSEAWNFGPELDSLQPVSWIIDKISELWANPITWEKSEQNFHETHVLSLNCSKSKSELEDKALLINTYLKTNMIIRNLLIFSIFFFLS